MSFLDHIYTQDATLITNLMTKETLVGVHKLLLLQVSESKTAPEVSWRRNWQRYNKELLLAELSKLNLDLTINNVQDQ